MLIPTRMVVFSRGCASFCSTVVISFLCNCFKVFRTFYLAMNEKRSDLSDAYWSSVLSNFFLRRGVCFSLEFRSVGDQRKFLAFSEHFLGGFAVWAFRVGRGLGEVSIAIANAVSFVTACCRVLQTQFDGVERIHFGRVFSWLALQLALKLWKILAINDKRRVSMEKFYNTAFVVGTNGVVVIEQAKSALIQVFRDDDPVPSQWMRDPLWGKYWDLHLLRFEFLACDEGDEEACFSNDSRHRT